ncbi:hypothetical protein [Streptomyces sp. NBC_01429]|uniref:hypothetical protein n=1 Tax=Streptomyces sp. NBC_01429 TaxID=2903862 RepID=UPI002E2B4614|nr:hypothetical protein [Streptomyces sp. NBC_01429]
MTQAFRSKYRGSYSGIAKLLKLPGVQRECRNAAVEIMAAAIVRAPVGNPSTDSHSGLYKSSFDVLPLMKNVPWKGQPRQRAGARVINTAPYALVVEYGSGRTPRYSVLSNAMDDVASRFRQ